MKDDEEKTWRKELKDGTFVEGIKHSVEHLHYNSDNGSDIPVNWRNEETGEGKDLRKTPLEDLKENKED